MLYVKNECNSPYFNLALEEYIFNNMDKEEYLLLWQNEPSIIIGKHQNTIEEINIGYIKGNNINVVRRLSGGGAVYNDFGNLNFTFIVKNRDISTFSFKKITEPVINALKKLGVKAEFNGRNNITIDGKQISGNFHYIEKDRLLYHGTLFFNSNLERLAKVLKVSNEKAASKKMKSVISRVTNISDYLNTNTSVLTFRDILLKYIFEEEKENREYELTEQELNEVNKIMMEKYLIWEWNYGESPKFNMKKSNQFENGKVEALLKVEKGIIKNCKFYGDFLGSGDLSDIEGRLIGLRYKNEEIRDVLSEININKYFASISLEQIISCIV